MAASPPADRHLPYAPGLDGLRALAVLAVILYHAGLGWLRGGFLGVEVFFVISGYLITSLLLSEWERQGRVSLKAFWLRRARRLLPALFATLLATLTFAVLFLPEEVASLRKDVLAATFYVTNWYLILDQKSYFEAIGRPSPLRHLWSLAVEEQFYIVWPILFSLAMRWLRRPIVLAAVLAAAAGSAGLMALRYVPDIDPSAIYYGTDTRATGLLVGVALALVWRPWLRPAESGRARAVALDLTGLAALLALVWFSASLGEFDPFLYQGGLALVALATAAAIAAVVHPSGHLSAWFLGRQPLRWLGLRSYSVYLWHWPVFMLTRPQLDLPLDGLPLLALRLALTALLAELSYRYVETPVRRGALGRAWGAIHESSGTRRRRLVAQWSGAIGTFVACLVALGVTAAQAQQPPPPDYLAVSALNTLGQAAATADGSPSHDGPRSAAPSSATAEPGPEASPGAAPPDGSGAQVVSDSSLLPAGRAITPTAEAAGVTTDSPTPPAQASPQPTAAPASPPPQSASRIREGKVTVVGDSVILSAWDAVHEVNPGLEVDGAVNRQAAEAIEVLRAAEEDGWLGSVVVIHIGNNGPFSSRQLDEMMRILGGERRVIFMTVKVPRAWEGPNNEVIVEGVRRYPNAELLDWRAEGLAHPEYFRDDGIHTSGVGAWAYANLIREAVK